MVITKSTLRRMLKYGCLRGEWITAMQELLFGYEGKGYLDSCPLCLVASQTQHVCWDKADLVGIDRKSISKDECDSCVWKYFEGVDCDTYYANYGYVIGRDEIYNNIYHARVHSDEHPEWVLLRIKMLRSWLKSMRRWA